jgi:hypothetical protein
MTTEDTENTEEKRLGISTTIHNINIMRITTWVLTNTAFSWLVWAAVGGNAGAGNLLVAAFLVWNGWWLTGLAVVLAWVSTESIYRFMEEKRKEGAK